MQLVKANNILRQWDGAERYVYLKCDLAKLFGETGNTLNETLKRLVKSNILERVARGIYFYRGQSSARASVIADIALAARRGKYVYESLESALSQWGRISQILIDRVTYMTTGRSATLCTQYGIIELTHTKRSPLEFLPQLIERPTSKVPLASEKLALQNLRDVGRNLSMVTNLETEVQVSELSKKLCATFESEGKSA